ncbi:FAD-dependent oxidoreductase [Helicobacter ailurogastricus]|uniref:Alanine dehydrogenase 1 n=1 Tax=Helicobacter ailurogastricus TaxID=1578720 RepID=A0A0K2Y2J6_9HELI|nr:FAD-dependent oxidoreductase [Helicobacter ailurogastricus]BDQ28667.1 alanine dehydrogenase [Helicobacter ailurogastricus]GMB91729.1 Alanine dehydrogenase Ald [Helicobacter ailurogastricus]CRI32195.1 Alanine dehydrogenase [Helicobacter ailurogastricus]
MLGLVKESMDFEFRVGLVPHDVAQLTPHFHVVVEKGAGLMSGYSDEAYAQAGAKIVGRAEAWAQSVVIKCKEPLEHEYALLQEGATLFSYLDLAYNKPLAQMFVDKKILSLCTETLAGPKNNYPVLAPMSVVAGQLAAHFMQHYLLGLEHLPNVFGLGLLLGGLSGQAKAKVVVVGGGVVGLEAAKFLSLAGARVVVLELDPLKLQEHPYKQLYHLEILAVHEENIQCALSGAVGLVGAVLVTATSTPKVILKRHLALMQRGGVVVDVACDLGGCVETIKQTSHSHPVYLQEGLLHYGVPNMPGVVAKTSSIAYSQASLPYLRYFLKHGLKGFLSANTKEVANTLGALSAYDGYLAQEGISKAFNLPFKSASAVLNSL